MPLAVKAGRLAQTIYTFFKIPRTRVFRCTFEATDDGSSSGGGSSSGDACTVATTEQYVGANGLAISDDRTKVYAKTYAVTRMPSFNCARGLVGS